MVRAILADDHKIVRQGLRALLEDLPEVEVLGEASNGREVVQMAAELSPDLVIMDVAMPDLNGMEATHQMLKEVPGVKVLALSMHSDKRYVRRMLQAGASGYLLKDSAFEELKRAIETVVADKVYLSPGISGVVLEDYLLQLESGEEPAKAQPLTPRKREILQLLTEGYSTREVAKQLHISIKTVETHRKQIMELLDLHSLAELTKYAVRHGLTSLE